MQIKHIWMTGHDEDIVTIKNGIHQHACIVQGLLFLELIICLEELVIDRAQLRQSRWCCKGSAIVCKRATLSQNTIICI